MFGSSPPYLPPSLPQAQARLGQQALKRRVVMRQLVVIPHTDNTPAQSVTSLLPVLREREKIVSHITVRLMWLVVDYRYSL